MKDFVSHVRDWAIEKHGTQTYGKYRGEHPEFRKAVYRPDLCEPVWAENDAITGSAHFRPPLLTSSPSTTCSS